MKTLFSRSLFLFGMATLALTACGQSEQKISTATAPVVTSPPIPAPPADPVPTTAEMRSKLEAYTFEQLAEFVTLVDDLGQQADKEQAALNVGYNEMMATPAQRQAMLELHDAAADFKSNTDSLDNAQAVTWETVRSNLTSSWVVLHDALANARSVKN